MIVIALALLVKSCDSSAATSALKNYNVSVYQLIKGSVSNAQTALNALKPGSLTSVGTQLASAEQDALNDLHKAESLQAPSQLAAAQSALVNVMQQRAQALKLIATYAPQAADKATSKDAVYEISLGTAQLFASDVIYKTVVTVDLAKALNSGGIPIGPGLHEQQINGGQVITDLGWLNQTWIADRIGAQLSTAQANVNNDQPGLHGHSLNSVTVDGTTLQAGITNDVPADKAQNWVLSLTNGGDFNEFDVGCSVKIVALSDEGTGVVPETYAHQGATCNVKLPSIPNTGPYQVIATIDKVPGETNLTNNTLTYNVDFT